MSRVEQGASAYARRSLHLMESDSKRHMLRETQAHISELKAEIKQYKAHRTSKLIKVNFKESGSFTFIRNL